mgnify:CR=1
MHTGIDMHIEGDTLTWELAIAWRRLVTTSTEILALGERDLLYPLTVTVSIRHSIEPLTHP